MAYTHLTRNKLIWIEERLNQWLYNLARNIFKTITFDCGKEFSNWKNRSNKHDIDIFFAS